MFFRALHGTWVGTGTGIYPTLPDFAYTETTHFVYEAAYPLVHFEQRTWLAPDHEPAHWESGFLRPRNSNGSWPPWDGPDYEHDAYTEGTGWQYLWMVPNDLDGLAEILGGREAALAKLREFFAASENETPSIGFRLYYWHGNEPDIIAPWIFAALGEPGESARWIDWIFTDHYGLGADGLPGNDDGGTLSAWLLFGAAGIYPIAGTDRYIVAAPRQELMVLHRPSGELRIEASPDPATHPVPLAVTLDGIDLTGAEIRHRQLVGDHVLHFTMGE
jgi:putative alpha-1,2-mannosidase